MASRRFFGYDPYDLYYVVPPVSYPHPYYSHHHAAPARHAAGFFPDAEDLDAYFYLPAPARRAKPPAAARAAARPEARASRPIPIPVHSGDSDPEPEVARVPVKRAPSAEAAAVRIQAAARGFLARRAVRALRAVEREAEDVAAKVAREEEALRGDARARVAVGEALMRLLLRLDAVRGAREYRRRVTKRVLALQDAVDALEPRPEPAAATEVPESELTEATAPAEAAAEMGMGVDNASPCAANETEQAAEWPDATGPAEESAEMELDGDGASGEPCVKNKTEQARSHGDSVSDSADEGEWGMVTDQPAPAAEGRASAEPPRHEATGEIMKAEKAISAGELDAKKVMEMVAALCERSAQQCAVIGALAERVDALERAVRRMEDAERRRRRAKKLKKEGKGSNQNKCYLD